MALQKVPDKELSFSPRIVRQGWQNIKSEALRQPNILEKLRKEMPVLDIDESDEEIDFNEFGATELDPEEEVVHESEFEDSQDESERRAESVVL